MNLFFKTLVVLSVIALSSISAFSQNIPSEVSTAVEGKQDGEKVDIFIDFGKSYYKQSKYDNSASCYIEAGKLYAGSGDVGGQAYCLNKAGKAYYKKGDYNNAIKVYKDAKNKYTKVDNKKGIYNASFGLGDSYSRKKDYNNAIKTYKTALNVASGAKKQAEVLHRIATVYSQWGNNDQAIKYFKETASKAKSAGLSSMESNALASIEALEENVANKETHVTQFEKEKEKEEEEYVENLQDDLEITKQENLMSMKEIESLSFEMQAKELKLYVIQEKYEKQVLETELKKRDIKLLEVQNNLKELEIRENETKIAEQKNRLLIVGASLGVVLLLLLLIMVLFRKNKKTLVIVRKQKEELDETNAILSQANEEIAAQRDELEEQKEVLNKQNVEITDSIRYAEKIQSSILPSEAKMKEYLPNFFILFKPKNIVSGDFYWFYKKGTEYWGAVVDCTGHGVPGAFMSMIGNSLLNKIILEDDTNNPSILLEKLNKELKFALGQSKSDEASDDGMDMTVVKINTQENKFTMSLANHNAFVVKDNNLEVIEGDIHSIGGMFSDMPNIKFTDHIIDISAGTSVYMFSDGYQDQFGGDDNKKFTQERMKENILKIQGKDLPKQKEHLENELENWVGMNKQIDDILVVGVKF